MAMVVTDNSSEASDFNLNRRAMYGVVVSLGQNGIVVLAVGSERYWLAGVVWC